jgi:hypothetical protein
VHAPTKVDTAVSPAIPIVMGNFVKTGCTIFLLQSNVNRLYAGEGFGVRLESPRLSIAVDTSSRLAILGGMRASEEAFAQTRS